MLNIISMNFFNIIVISLICLIPVVVGFFIVKSIYIGLGDNKLRKLGLGFAGWAFFLLVLLAIGVYAGVVPLSVFGIDYQPTIGIDENGNPDCTPVPYLGGGCE